MKKIPREEGTLFKKANKQTKACCSCQLEHTMLTPTVSLKSGTHAFLT
jgi:hypothetical protein